jgi:hypothetical protein
MGGELGGPGVVEQGVDAAEALRLGGDGATGGVVSDVALNGDGLGAVTADQVAGLLGLLGGRSIVDHHRLGAAAGGFHGDGATEASGSARHHDDRPVEVPAHLMRLLKAFSATIVARRGVVAGRPMVR